MIPESNNKPRLIEAPHSTCLQSAFIAACQWLDSSIVAPFIGEDDVFPDCKKTDFIKGLDELFSLRSKRIGERFSSSYRTTTCNGCSEGKGWSVYHFEFYQGKQNVQYSDFAFLIREECGVVIDIFRCYSYDSACLIDVNVFDEDDELVGTESINWELWEEGTTKNKTQEEDEDEDLEDDV